MTKLPSPKELRHICGDIKPEHNHWRERAARWISIRITLFLLWIFPSITPNQITILMLAMGFLSAFFFMSGTYLAILFGVVLYHLYLILDACDGEVARYKKLYSRRGLYLDYLGHILVNPLIIFGIAVGVYRMNPVSFIPQIWWLIFGFVTFYAMIANNVFKLKKYEMLIDKKEFKELEKSEKNFKKDDKQKNQFMQEFWFFFRIMTFNSILVFGVLNLMWILVILNFIIFPLQGLKRFYSEMKSFEN